MTTFTQSPFHQPMRYVMWHSLLHDTIQWLHWPGRLYQPMRYDMCIACCMTLYNDCIYPVTFPSTHALCHMCHSLLHDTIQWLHLPSRLSINPCTMSHGIACCTTSVWWQARPCSCRIKWSKVDSSLWRPKGFDSGATSCWWQGLEWMLYQLC